MQLNNDVKTRDVQGAAKSGPLKFFLLFSQQPFGILI